MDKVVKRELAACNGGPGLTARELAARVGMPEAFMRNVLAQLVFHAKEVTCDKDGRYKLGNPERLLMQG